MDTNSGLRRGVILALSIVVLMMSSSLAVAQDVSITEPSQEIDYTRELIEVDKNIEEGKISLKLGEAEMYVSYGNGRIILASIQTKYMGIADIYDDDNHGFKSRVGIPTKTVFVQSLIGAGEYVDTNENGLFDVTGPKVAGTIEELEDEHVSHEELLKWVDYNDISWSLSEWSQTANDNEVNINFVITSSNITYNNISQTLDGQVIESISYIFHVTTVEEEIHVEAVPHYEVFARQDAAFGDRIDSSELITKTNVTGHVLNSTWKYDQVIDGWDIATDSDGNTRNDTRLVVLTEMSYGVSMHSMVGEWMKEEFGGLLSPKAIAGNAPHRLLPPQGVAPPPMPEHDMSGHPLDCGLAYFGPTPAPANGRSSDNSDNGVSESQENKHGVHDRMKEYQDTACKQRGEEIQMSDETRPEAIRAGAIHFEDNGANLGRIRWVSNATVDGVETEVLFQLHGARPVLPKDVRQDPREDPMIDCNENEKEDAVDISSGTSDDYNENGIPDECEDGVIWSGVRIVGGYNYVLGSSVYHDPEFSSDVLTIETQSFGDPIVYGNGNFAKLISNLVQMIPMALGVVILAAVTIGVASSRSRREQAPIPSQQQYVPAGAWASDDDWSQYQQ